MKIKALLLMCLLAVFSGVVLPRQAAADVTFSYFYESLQPYGDWVDVEKLGYCWQPRGVDKDWRPYTDGYWSYTDAGWTWVSYEDFGSITYHYGRWARLEDIGWVWRPDYQWGPAWVSWRQSDDYVGWAPLPPDAAFDDKVGIGVWVDRDYDIGPSAYSFCEYRYFGEPVIFHHIIPRHRNVFIINNSVNITNIAYVTGGVSGRLIFNGGPDFHRISERSEHHIAVLQLMRQTDGDWARNHRVEHARQVGNQLIINAPVIQVNQTRVAPVTVVRQIQSPKVDRGWAGVANATEREQIKQRYTEQTKGLTRTSAPATPVNATQVQSVITQQQAQQPQNGKHALFGPKPSATVPQTNAAPQTLSIPQQPQPSQTPQGSTGGKHPGFSGGSKSSPSAPQIDAVTQPSHPGHTPQVQREQPRSTPTPVPQATVRQRQPDQVPQVQREQRQPQQVTQPQPQRQVPVQQQQPTSQSQSHKGQQGPTPTPTPGSR